MVANVAINGNDPTWFDQVLNALAKETKETEERVKERWLARAISRKPLGMCT
jgi:hypothetical protein